VHGWAIRQTIRDFVAGTGRSADWLPSLTPSQMLLVHTDQTIVKAALAQHHRHLQQMRRASSASLPPFSFAGALFAVDSHLLSSRPRLRLGYLSYSFGSGTRNGLLTEVLGRHFATRVEVFAYALRPHDASDDGIKRKEIEKNFEHWFDVSGYGTFGEISRRINGDGVQVLVDLCGLHSNGTNVYAVFSDKPAPVQVMCNVRLVLGNVSHDVDCIYGLRWNHRLVFHDLYRNGCYHDAAR
jgi:predicted O-linked N-acetylglucosamine transferase (SPINDLY family)